jgi:hypothetical protein
MKADIRLETIHRYHAAQYRAHQLQASDQLYCAISAREALVTAYSFYSHGRYVKPQHKFVVSDLPTRDVVQAVHRNKRMLTTLKKNMDMADLVVSESSTKVSNNYRSQRKRKHSLKEVALLSTRDWNGNPTPYVVPVPISNQKGKK